MARSQVESVEWPSLPYMPFVGSIRPTINFRSIGAGLRGLAQGTLAGFEFLLVQQLGVLVVQRFDVDQTIQCVELCETATFMDCFYIRCFYRSCCLHPAWARKLRVL